MFGCGLLLPPAAPGSCAPSVFLLRLSVPLPSCRTLSFCCFLPGVHPLAFVQAWVGRLRSSVGSSVLEGWGGGLSFPCPRYFCLAVPPILLSRLLGFLGLLTGVSLLSLPVFTDGSGCLADGPWFSALRCLAPGGVVLFSGRGLSCCPIRAAVALVFSVLRGSGSSRWGHLPQVGTVFFLRPQS